MALNFPSSPTIGQVYTDSTSGFSYEWDGTVWRSFTPSSSSQIKTLDDISASFDGVTQSFPLTSNSSAISPASAQSLIINLGGVIQDPTDDYGVSGSNLIFSTPPVNGLSFSGVSLGPAIPVSTIPDGTTTEGDFIVSGSVSANSFISLSDENLKTNIETIDNALEKLSSIRGVSFEWKEDNTPSMGVIAQELEKVFPDLVISKEYKSVNYDGIIGVLIEAVKELQKKIDRFESNK
jgi:hypothetical protein